VTIPTLPPVPVLLLPPALVGALRLEVVASAPARELVATATLAGGPAYPLVRTGRHRRREPGPTLRAPRLRHGGHRRLPTAAGTLSRPRPRWITIAPPGAAASRGGVDHYRAVGWVTLRAPLKPCLPDEIASALYRARRREAGTRRYQASDFTGDPRSAEGRLALLAYRTRCAGLVDALAAQRNRTALAAWVGESLMTLPVAFGGRVSLVNAIDSIQEALRSHVRLASRTRTYGANQKVSPEVTSEIWPTGLIAPDAVPRTVLAELAKGSPWKFGELLAPPTPEQEREIRLALDPQAFERVIVDAVGDGTEVRSAALYDRLHAENLTGGATPSPAERARVRVALEALGFARAEGVDPDGRRCRVWRRPPKVATPAPEAAQ